MGWFQRKLCTRGYMKKETKNYVEKSVLLMQIVEFQEACRFAEANGKPRPKMPDTIGKAIYDTVNGVASRPNFRGYSFIEDMKSDATEDCVNAVLKFDPENAKKNPFGYFSKCIFWAFIGRITKEKKEHADKLEMMFDPGVESWSTLDGDTTDYGASNSKNELLDFYYRNKL